MAALGEMAFDHARILQDGVERARAKLEYTPLAAAFCQDEFTVAELRRVYEIVWGTPLDPRNFHRKVTGAERFLVEAGADLVGRRAGPQLYRRGTAELLHPPMLRPREPGENGSRRRGWPGPERAQEDNGVRAITAIPAGTRPVRPVQAGQGAGGAAAAAFKLSSNESPFGPLPSVIKVIAEAAGTSTGTRTTARPS